VNRIADYGGTLLSHVETLYRPGERELAIELVEALGCAVTDTGFKGDGADTFLAVHPNPDDQDPQNNAFYMSQIRPEQLAVEQRMVVVEQQLHDRPVVAVDGAARHIDAEHAVRAGHRDLVRDHDLRRSAGEGKRDELHRREPTYAGPSTGP